MKKETLNEVALEFAKDFHEMYETSNFGSMHFGFCWGAKYQKEKQDDFAIGFVLFLSDNLYESMYQDIDEDGKIWVSYFHDGHNNHSTAQRFTIQELLEIYKKEL